MHAGHAYVVRVAGGKSAQAHQGADGESLGGIHKFRQLGRGVAEHDAAAGVHQRSLGFEHQLGGAADLAGVALREYLVAGEVDCVNRRVVALGLENVLRDVDQDRTGTAGRRDVEGFVDDLRQFSHGLDHEIVLGGRTGNAERVGFLERVAADELGVHLTGDGDYWDRIHHGIHQAGH